MTNLGALSFRACRKPTGMPSASAVCFQVQVSGALWLLFFNIHVFHGVSCILRVRLHLQACWGLLLDNITASSNSSSAADSSLETAEQGPQHSLGTNTCNSSCSF